MCLRRVGLVVKVAVGLSSNRTLLCSLEAVAARASGTLLFVLITSTKIDSTDLEPWLPCDCSTVQKISIFTKKRLLAKISDCNTDQQRVDEGPSGYRRSQASILRFQDSFLAASRFWRSVGLLTCGLVLRACTRLLTARLKGGSGSWTAKAVDFSSQSACIPELAT